MDRRIKRVYLTSKGKAFARSIQNALKREKEQENERHTTTG